jgi:hypothetical protein
MNKYVIIAIFSFFSGLSILTAEELKDSLLKEFIINILKSRDNYIEFMQNQNLVDCKNYINKIIKNSSLKTKYDSIFNSIDTNTNRISTYKKVYSINKKRNSVLIFTIDKRYQGLGFSVLINNDSTPNERIVSLELEPPMDSSPLENDNISIIIKKFIKELMESDKDEIKDFFRNNVYVDCSEYLKNVQEYPRNIKFEQVIDFFDNDFSYINIYFSHSIKESILYDNLIVIVLIDNVNIVFSFNYNPYELNKTSQHITLNIIQIEPKN